MKLELKEKIYRLPWTFILLVIIIALIGFVQMYSAAQGSFYPWAFKQIIFFVTFLLFAIIISLIDLRNLYQISYLIYFFCLIFLILVEISGHTAMGATRWINLGLIKIQPSEFMKIAIVFPLARYFHDLNKTEITLKDILIPIIITALPAALIIKQPDLGTAIIFMVVSSMIIFSAGLKKRIIIFGIFAISALLPLIWNNLYDYQKNRILTFFNPDADPLGKSYNIIQSKIAIGSGGFYGKGFLKGTQNQLSFLPEHQTDFAFTMICEEWGFIGAILYIMLISLLLILSYSYFLKASSPFAKFLGLGMSSIIFWQVFINIAMVTGMIPTVGVPLPLVSYGGTMMLTILFAIGIIINVNIHQKTKIPTNIKSYI